MDIKELKELFKKNIIPTKAKTPVTFLGIAKQPHYENVISNIYAFFFDPDQEHGFKDLFIKTLIHCINTKTKKKEINQSLEYDIRTEVYTKNKLRIDILLKSEDSALIIENKIYHHLDNSLGKYWDSATEDLDDTSNSIGIILSLFEIKSDNENFICITHKEFLDQINKNIGSYHINCNPKYLMFLQDFQQNLFNQSKKMMTEENLKIYLENQNQIEDAIALKKEYKKKLYEQIKAIEFEKFNNPKLIKRLKTHPSKKSSLYRNVSLFESINHKSLRVKISYENLKKKDNCFEIRVDLWPLKDNNYYEQILEKFQFNKLKPEQSKIKNKVIAIKEYQPNTEEKLNLTQFVATKLVDDGFLDVFNQLDDILTELKKHQSSHS